MMYASQQSLTEKTSYWTNLILMLWNVELDRQRPQSLLQRVLLDGAPSSRSVTMSLLHPGRGRCEGPFNPNRALILCWDGFGRKTTHKPISLVGWYHTSWKWLFSVRWFFFHDRLVYVWRKKGKLALFSCSVNNLWLKERWQLGMAEMDREWWALSQCSGFF